eukprot:gene2167-3320_t
MSAAALLFAAWGAAGSRESGAVCEEGEGRIVHVPNAKLFVSEPSPRQFGNAPNPKQWSAAGWTAENWLTSRFHFNFAEYSNARNPPFGVLRVVNDDLVQPKRGFGTHPHRNVEIVTYVVAGELTHSDSQGNEETLGPGSVQYMSAGTGVSHSEANNGNVPVRFIQTWLTPARQNLHPNYGSYRAPEGAPEGWTHLVSDARQDRAAPVGIHQDADMYSAVLPANASSVFSLKLGRQAYIVCLEGAVDLSAEAAPHGASLVRHDAAEAYGSA